MADQDKDRTNPTAGQKAGPGSPNSDLTSNTQQRTGAGGASTGSSAAGAGTNSGMSGSAGSTDDLKNAGRRAVDEAKHYTKDMAGNAKEQGRSMLEGQKESAAGQVDSAAHAFRNTAEQLQGEGQSQASRYVGMFAEQLESLGNQLRHKNMDTLIRDAEDLGRRSPGVFLAGSVVAGFLLARFLKSSAEHRHEQGQGDMSHNDQRFGSMRDGERWDSTSNAYGAAGSDASAVLGGRPSASSPSASSISGASGSGTTGSTIAGSSASASSSSSDSVAPASGTGVSGATDKPASSSSSTASTSGGNSHGNR